MEHQVVRAAFQYKGEAIYVNHVPAGVCAHCADQYFDAPVYKWLEQIA